MFTFQSRIMDVKKINIHLNSQDYACYVKKKSMIGCTITTQKTKQSAILFQSKNHNILVKLMNFDKDLVVNPIILLISFL